MTTIEFSTSAPKYQSKIVANIEIPEVVRLGVETIDRRKLLGPRSGKISVRLPAPIMTDFGKGPLRPGISQISKYRMIGALLDVTITDDVMSGHGVLYKPLPEAAVFWPGADIGKSVLKFYKNGRIDMREWQLIAVSLRNYGPIWPDLPPVIITGRE